MKTLRINMKLNILDQNELIDIYIFRINSNIGSILI